MEITQETLNGIAQILENTFKPLTAKEAEAELKKLESQPRFLICLFRIMTIDAYNPSIKFAASLYTKNLIRREWHITGNDDNIISSEDRTFIKNSIVELIMLSPENIQIQLSESLNTILYTEEVGYWKDVLGALTSRFDIENYNTNVAALRVIYFFMKRFKSEKECLELGDDFPVIIDLITNPILQLLIATIKKVGEVPVNFVGLKYIFESILLMVKIYLVSCTHDIPQSFDDHSEACFEGFHYLLNYQNPALETQDPEEVGVLEKIRTSICEICRLYYYKYNTDFRHARDFLNSIWNMLVNIGPEPKYDMLVSKAMGFITTMIRRTGGDDIFKNDDVLKTICEKIIVPNCRLRESDIHLLEDEPIEYVRREIDGSSLDSRRHASIEIIRACVAQYEARMAKVFMEYSAEFISKYDADPVNNWWDKDTANFLFNAITIKTFTHQAGAVKIINGIDINLLYQQTVLPELNPVSNSHPVLKVDAIKFVSNFRSHLKHQQLLEILPFLIEHLKSPHYIVYTFAAICIERILFLKVDGNLIFTEEIIKPYLENLLGYLFDLAERPTTPEKMAENEFIMRTVMRVILIGKQTIKQYKALVSKKLGHILSIVSKNPSNPKYNHYLFECIGAVVRITNLSIEEFETTFWASFEYILSENITEFIPYVIQIVAQILSCHNRNQPLPMFFQNFWKPIVQPAFWENKGNIPALVKLIKEYLKQGTSFVSDMNNIRAVLGVFNKLLHSKPYEEYSFGILEALFLYIDMSILDQFIQPIFLKILQRLKSNSSLTLTISVAKFVCFLLTIQKSDINPDMVLSFFERAYSGSFSKLLSDYIVPRISSIRQTDRTLVANGLTILLTKTPAFLVEENHRLWVTILETLVNHLHKPLNEVDLSYDIESYDINETEFQNAYVKLATSSSQEVNPALVYGPPEIFLVSSLNELNSRTNGLATRLSLELSPQANFALDSFSRIILTGNSI